MTTLTDTQVITASGGLVELGYSQITSNLTISSNTAGSGTEVIAPLTVVCDGSPVLVEFWCGQTVLPASGQISVSLYRDGAEVHRQWSVVHNPSSSGSAYPPIYASYRTTPPAGSHTFSVKAYGPSSPQMQATGTNNAPIFLRVSKIVTATQWPAVTTGTIICTSSTRPSAPFPGQLIWETDTNLMRVYVSNLGWNSIAPQALSVEYLVVAGGGQAGGSAGQSIASGGGGAGGMLTNRLTGTRHPVSAGTPYTVIVGGGGANAATGFYTGTAGGQSRFDTIICTGGGGGGTWGNQAGSGGSGGGAGENGQGLDGGAGTAGQGYRGGNDQSYDSGTGSVGAGGGGASGSGYDVQANAAGVGGSGGDGRASDITGTWVMYAGGGGGGGNAVGGKGGEGGGGTGAAGTATGANATANTGGGGGGSCTNANEAAQRGGYGGSGIVVVRYPSIFPTATVTGSPSVTTVGTDRVYTWTSVGTWSITFN